MSFYVSSSTGRAYVNPFGVALVGTPNRNPQRLPAYRDHGCGLWFEGEPGKEFGIEIIVPPQGRYAVLISVSTVGAPVRKSGRGAGSGESIWVFNAPTRRGSNVVTGRPLSRSKTFSAFTFPEKDELEDTLPELDTAFRGFVRVRFVHENVCGNSADGFSVLDREGNQNFSDGAQGVVGNTRFAPDLSRGVATLAVHYASKEFLQRSSFAPIQDEQPPRGRNPFWYFGNSPAVLPPLGPCRCSTMMVGQVSGSVAV
jgi:hypothetical protein